VNLAEDMPAVFDVANQAAMEGRDETKRFVRWELRLGVLAASMGVLTWRVSEADLDVFAGIGTVAFLLAAVLALGHAVSRPEQRWYRGRAAAESAKTLAFRYAVGGDPFPTGEEQEVADDRLLRRFADVVKLLSTLELPSPSAGAAHLTPTMRAIRQSDFHTRRGHYKRQRIDNQCTWYSNRSRQHRRSAKRWAIVAIAAHVAGVCAGALRFFGAIDVDLLGLAAAVAAAAAAWTQLLQHRTLATSYSLAALELERIRDGLVHVTEDEWPLYVSDAEDAISREHTLWLARRGHPLPPNT
jgi:hypothetical protein